VPAAAVPPRAPAARLWSPWQEARRDWRWLLGLFCGLAVTGAPLGVLWWALAPRADYRITSGGPVPIGTLSEEILVADDGIFVLIVAALGLVAGVLTWLVRRRRGVAALLGVALGTSAGAALAWQVGELLGPGPSRSALTHVGGTVTTSLTLGMLPALAVGPFVAVLVWVVGTLYSRNDALGRGPSPGDVPPALPSAPAPGEREGVVG
jgi:Protein of unknown function (DUF2567)